MEEGGARWCAATVVGGQILERDEDVDRVRRLVAVREEMPAVRVPGLRRRGGAVPALFEKCAGNPLHSPLSYSSTCQRTRGVQQISSTLAANFGKTSSYGQEADLRGGGGVIALGDHHAHVEQADLAPAEQLRCRHRRPSGWGRIFCA